MLVYGFHMVSPFFGKHPLLNWHSWHCNILMLNRKSIFNSKKVTCHTLRAHPFGNPPFANYERNPFYSPLEKVARGLFQRCVETTLDQSGSIFKPVMLVCWSVDVCFWLRFTQKEVYLTKWWCDLPNFQGFLPNLSSQALVHAEDI